MGLPQILEQKKEKIVKSWFDGVIATYPEGTAEMLNNQNDPFSNPIGTSTRQTLKAVFDELINGLDHETMTSFLDPVIRMRAVQNFTPSNAVSFVFQIKNIIRKILVKEIADKTVKDEELLAFDQKVDEVALIAFDIYMGCREQIFTYRANHVKSRTMKLLEKADILCEVPEVGTEIIPHDVYKNGGFENG